MGGACGRPREAPPRSVKGEGAPIKPLEPVVPAPAAVAAPRRKSIADVARPIGDRTTEPDAAGAGDNPPSQSQGRGYTSHRNSDVGAPSVSSHRRGSVIKYANAADDEPPPTPLDDAPPTPAGAKPAARGRRFSIPVVAPEAVPPPPSSVADQLAEALEHRYDFAMEDDRRRAQRAFDERAGGSPSSTDSRGNSFDTSHSGGGAEPGGAEPTGLGSGSIEAERLRSRDELLMSQELVGSGRPARAPWYDDAEFPAGSFTCRGVDEGVPKTNQDAAAFATPFAALRGTALFVVCDGHGRDGDTVSREVLNSLVYELEEHAEAMITRPALVIADAFAAVDAHLRLMATSESIQVDARESGACVVLAYLRGSTLWVGGAGDCRAVLGTRRNGALVSRALSNDHKVDLAAERERLEGRGGFIQEAYQEEENGPWLAARLYSNPEKVPKWPGLCISRVLGDLSAARLGVIPHPEVNGYHLSDDDEYLVLATDGVWEFLDADAVLDVSSHRTRAGPPRYRGPLPCPATTFRYRVPLPPLPRPVTASRPSVLPTASHHPSPSLLPGFPPLRARHSITPPATCRCVPSPTTTVHCCPPSISSNSLPPRPDGMAQR